MPFIRKVRVLCKTRLIFPRINGPNRSYIGQARALCYKEGYIFENKAKNCGCVLNSFYFFTGRVRTSLTPPPLGEGSLHTVSLNVLSPQVQSHPDENKSVFRFEAAWDSSLHNSILLNRYS